MSYVAVCRKSLNFSWQAWHGKASKLSLRNTCMYGVGTLCRVDRICPMVSWILSDNFLDLHRKISAVGLSQFSLYKVAKNRCMIRSSCSSNAAKLVFALFGFHYIRIGKFRELCRYRAKSDNRNTNPRNLKFNLPCAALYNPEYPYRKNLEILNIKYIGQNMSILNSWILRLAVRWWRWIPIKNIDIFITTKNYIPDLNWNEWLAG